MRSLGKAVVGNLGVEVWLSRREFDLGSDMGQGIGKVPGLFVHSFLDFPWQESLFEGGFFWLVKRLTMLNFRRVGFLGSRCR